MSQTKQPADESPATAQSPAEEVVKKTAAEILLERKVAAANNRNLPPHLNPIKSHKGQKIATPPRGTRKTMGKR